jgi:hypothetical protein
LFTGSVDRVSGEAFELFAIVDQAAGGSDAFAVAPDALGRIQFGSVGGKIFQMHIPHRSTPPLEVFAFVLVQIVQQDDQRCAEGASQSPEVRDQIVLIHAAAGQELRVQPAAMSRRRNAERSEHRQLFPVSQPVPEDGCLADRRPRAVAVGLRQKAGFIEKDERRSELPGFFLIRGQSFAIQPSMADWLRSKARRLGFCTDHPSDLSSAGRYRTWYETPNSRRMSSAIRGQVHSCPAKPAASGPAASSLSSRCCAGASSFGLAPGALPVFSAEGRRPPADFCTQSCTDRVEQPNTFATREALQFSRHTNRTARRRTSWPYGSLPCLLIRV